MSRRMSTRTPALSRRRLLAGLGASAAALPFFGRMPSAEAEVFPKRFVVFFSPNEPIRKEFWQPSSGFGLTDVMQPLKDYKDKLLLIGDMQMLTRDKDKFGGGHVGIGHALTGEINIPYGSAAYEFWAGGISVDQFIAKELGVDALTLAARPGGSNGNNRISYTDKNEPVHPIEDPQKAFDQVLGTFSLPPDELAALRAQKKSVFQSVASQLSTVQKKLGKEDRAKLERHLEMVHKLESNLTGGPGLSCTPIAPTGGYDFASNSDYPITGRRHIDVLVQALACDATRVGSIQLGNSGAGNITPVWPDFQININVDEHNIAHNYNSAPNASSLSERVALERFYYSQFAYLLEQLESVKEGDGTLLDNTLVLWAKPIGRNHGWTEMLFMLAGGHGDGSYTPGRYIERKDVPHNNLLVTCCQLMGLDVSSYGDPDLCTGAVSL